MSSYYRLTLFEREEISLGLAKGFSLRKIAISLSRAPSTISREISHNRRYDQTYRAAGAQAYANKLRRKAHKRRKLDTNEPLRQFVFEHLENLWSPEQIAKRLKMLYPVDMDMQISHESIYSYLYVLPKGTLRRQLAKALRRHHKNRRVRDKVRRKCCSIQEFLSIEERPQEVADRTVPGHWEGDLIVGRLNTSALGTLVERTTRMTFLIKLKSKDATTVRKAFAEQFRHLPEGLRRSLTYDQGQEMAEHKLFTKSTNIKVYFAHPHSPWERGTNENTNALVRQFFPRGIDFNKVSYQAVKRAQDILNDRPRKTLNFYTPHEMFSKLVALET